MSGQITTYGVVHAGWAVVGAAAVLLLGIAVWSVVRVSADGAIEAAIAGSLGSVLATWSMFRVLE